MNPHIELPGLESIKRGVHPALIWSLLCVPIAAIVAIVALVVRGDFFSCALAAAYGVPTLIIFAVPIFLRSYAQYLTTPDGITARGLFRTRTIRWSDVKLVTVMPDGKRRIVSDHDDMIIPISRIELVGSVWQHLRRHGMEQGFQLWPSARSFWEPVPDLPDEIAWANPRPPSAWLYIVGRLYPWIIIPLYLLHMLLSWFGWSSILVPWVPFVMLPAILIGQTAWVPRRVKITPDLLIVDYGREHKEIPWDRVRLGMASDSSHRTFVWHRGGVSIPVRPNDPQVGRILWALSYKLRYQPKPSLFLGPVRGADQAHCIWIPKPGRAS